MLEYYKNGLGSTTLIFANVYVYKTTKQLGESEIYLLIISDIHKNKIKLYIK